jgi:hypothetical protein
MAKHPYVGVTGALIQVLDQLKKSFPGTLDADVLRKLGFAPKNESYIINTIRFIKLIDESGARTEKAQRTFTLHDPATFSKAFADLVKSAYSDLFKLHGDAAWTLNNAKLITYFRQTDQSSELVGTRQANTFRTLATYAGQLAAPAPTAKVKSASTSGGKQKTVTLPKLTETPNESQSDSFTSGRDEDAADRRVGLTVRIEINLPANGDQSTYDKIFKSIRENLLNA